MNQLIILSGLPGAGKTMVARELARQIGALHLRIDSIEQALRDCGPISFAPDEAGYCVAYSVAEDNLRIGHTVIADSVNPLPVTRNAWLEVAQKAGVAAIEIEITCSDHEEHRRRVETRTADVPGLRLPTWQEVVSRDYQPWDREPIVIDTASRSAQENVKMLRATLAF